MNSKGWFRLLTSSVLIFVLLMGCSTQTPSPTPAPTSTPSPSPSPTLEPTLAPTPTPSPADAVLEGDELLRVSDFEGAKEVYERAIAIDESYGLAYSGLSQIYMWQGIRSNDALAHAQKGAELAPDDPITHAVLARAQRRKFELEDAMVSAQYAAELDPDNAFVQANLAQAYIDNNQFDLAQQAAEAAFSLDPQDAFTLFTLGSFYEWTADFGRAQAAYEQAVMLEPEFVGWQMSLGDYWYHRDHYDDAEKNYEEILEQVPEYIPALLGLAYVELDRYAFPAAEEFLNVVLELTPEEPSGYIGIGYLNYEQGEYEDALAQYNKAIELAPHEYGVREAIGYVYLKQQECDLADRQFQELAASFPNWAGPLIGRGDAQFCEGDVNKALAHFRDAIEVDTFSYIAQTELGYGYLFQERWEDARDAFLEALQISPTTAWVHGVLGDWFWYQGMLEEAETENRIALQQNPYLPEAYLRLGELLLIQEDMDGAQESVEIAVELDPTDLSARKLLGIIHANQGNVQSAIQVFEEVLEEDPEDAASHLYLGLALRDLGEYRRAKEELKTFLGIAGNALSEDEIFLLNYLVETLELDYILSEEKALEQLAEFGQILYSQTWDMDVEDLEEEGRTLVVTIPITPADLESGAYLEGGISYAAVASLFVPRVDPPIENGLLIQYTLWGEPLFTVKSTLMSLKQFSDTLIDSWEIVERMEFDLVEETDHQVSFNLITRDLATLRELDMDQSIPSETLDREAVHDHLVDSIDEQVSDSFERDASVLTLLGVISPTLDLEEVWVDLQSEQVAGFYVPEEKIIYIVESDEESALDQLVLAHECIHALQDQSFGLEALGDTSLNDDQNLAFQALVEGDATLATILYMEETIPIMDQLDASSQAGGFDSEALEAAPDFISGISTFPYIKGLEFVTALYQRDGWDLVNQAYAELPQSTEHILHPESYIDGEMPVDVTLPEISTALGDGWQEVEDNVLGELGLQLTLAEHLGSAASEQASEGWGGDKFVLLHNDVDDTYSLVLRTTWDDQEEADEFWSLYRSYMDHRSGYSEVVKIMIGDLSERWWSGERDHVYVSQDETDVTIVIGSDMVDVEEIVSFLQDQLAAMER